MGGTAKRIGKASAASMPPVPKIDAEQLSAEARDMKLREEASTSTMNSGNSMGADGAGAEEDEHENRIKCMLEEHETRMNQAIEEIKIMEETKKVEKEHEFRNSKSATFDYDDDPGACCAQADENANFDDGDPCPGLVGLRPSKKVKRDRFIYLDGAPWLSVLPAVPLMLENAMFYEELET